MTTDEFFRERKAAAVLKHGILRRYLQIFCSKTGSTSKENRVVYLDGYAGPGVYSAGEPGSPALAAETASQLAGLRNLVGVYVEQDHHTADELATNLKDTGHAYVIFYGEIEECLPHAMKEVGEEDPLFAFFDPFGLAIPLAHLAKVFQHSRVDSGVRQGPPTEVLLNFSYPGLRRTAGHLTADSEDARYQKARASILARLDATLGGDWWRPIWLSEDEDRVQQIVLGYIKRVKDVAKITGWYKVPVCSKWGGPVVYDLLFFTHHPEQGLWHFNECVSLAWGEYYQFCIQGELDLQPEEIRDSKWVAIIKGNIADLLKAQTSFSVFDMHSEIFGDTLGYAREKHLRKAIKELYKEGVVNHDGRGELRSAILRAPPGP